MHVICSRYLKFRAANFIGTAEVLSQPLAAIQKSHGLNTDKTRMKKRFAMTFCCDYRYSLICVTNGWNLCKPCNFWRSGGPVQS